MGDWKWAGNEGGWRATRGCGEGIAGADRWDAPLAAPNTRRGPQLTRTESRSIGSLPLPGNRQCYVREDEDDAGSLRMSSGLASPSWTRMHLPVGSIRGRMARISIRLPTLQCWVTASEATGVDAVRRPRTPRAYRTDPYRPRGLIYTSESALPDEGWAIPCHCSRRLDVQ